MNRPPRPSAADSRAWPHRAGELGDRLPDGFIIGTASSAFQAEGGARDGGRAESHWDPFTRQAGRIIDGSNASVSADHFHRLGEDLTLLTELGVDAYRFSLAWPRVQPDGRGALTGLAFYDRLVDELLVNGIRPMATLLHWDTPIALRGAWLNRDTASRFGDYAYQVGEYFRDRIDSWVTLNDPATVTLSGYALGTHAPGETLRFDALPAAHHQLLGHGLAVQALRAADVTGQVGIALGWSPVEPAVNRDDDRAAAALFNVLHNHLYADAVLLGRYPEPPDEFRSELRLLLETEPDDLVTIHQPLDFLGLNYSAPSRIKAGVLPPVRSVAAPAATRSGIQTDAPPQLPFHFLPFRELPVTSSGHPVAPEYLAVALTELRDRYEDRLPPVVITSAGASYTDVVDAHGDVHDPLRIDYLAEHLVAATEAVAPGGAAHGVNLRGFFLWTLLDAFEWTAGYTQPYGLVHVDFAAETRVRTPKTSYRWLQNVLEQR